MGTNGLKSLAAAIAETVKDYRQHEAAPPAMTPAHVLHWVAQFDEPVREPLLTEVSHVLGKTYVDRATVVKFLGKLCTNAKIAGSDPASFWPKVNFLDVQGGGQSQTEMLEIFGQALKATFGIKLSNCGSAKGPYLYLDDGVFSGNRLLQDLRAFAHSAPQSVQLHVVVIAMHTGGEWYVGQKAQEAFKALGKSISITWWRAATFESRKSSQDLDVLRPTYVPSTKAMKAYEPEMAPHGPALRSGNHLGSLGTFSSPEGRELLEQQLLGAGLRVRGMCLKLKDKHRPLGYAALKGLGFGSTLVTYRNCPNSCPLAFWVGDPWYPLFPRKNN